MSNSDKKSYKDFLKKLKTILENKDYPALKCLPAPGCGEFANKAMILKLKAKKAFAIGEDLDALFDEVESELNKV